MNNTEITDDMCRAALAAEWDHNGSIGFHAYLKLYDKDGAIERYLIANKRVGLQAAITYQQVHDHFKGPKV